MCNLDQKHSTRYTFKCLIDNMSINNIIPREQVPTSADNTRQYAKSSLIFFFVISLGSLVDPNLITLAIINQPDYTKKLIAVASS